MGFAGHGRDRGLGEAGVQVPTGDRRRGVAAECLGDGVAIAQAQRGWDWFETDVGEVAEDGRGARVVHRPVIDTF